MRWTVTAGEAFHHIRGRRLGRIRESALEIWLILTANPPFAFSVCLRYDKGRKRSYDFKLLQKLSALLSEARDQPLPHFLLPKGTGNNWWWITSIRKQMIQKHKKSLHNCWYRTMSGIPISFHVRHSCTYKTLVEGCTSCIYLTADLFSPFPSSAILVLFHLCVCVCFVFTFFDRISILSFPST